ncbi:MAG: hypothetical protein OES79_16975, partial [Planctomycetota bacterium]|nr:hypothetical protein [Planctomycetota bacterium]
SLGWSDLDVAFDSVLQQSDDNTHVLYIGDGIATTTTADPVAFAQRLRKAYQDNDRGGAFHAISVGSTYEPIALKAIASLGGGSFRQVSGDRTPQLVVKELLSEIAQPAIRDLKVEFRGLRVAAVYPEQIPNLVAGAQQIVLARYLPEGTDQQGEVIVTGTQNGKPVRFSSDISLKDDDKGNSFIPRLWSRMHLDQLLQQGDSQSIKDEIIALSEEFHIITPYTSLLVLETDEDRERFKVKRRFLMRDGERFFAEGRDQADYELVQKQMRRAGGWRIGLRRMVLQQLSNLGRDLSAIGQLANSGISIDRLMPMNRAAGLHGGGQGGGGSGGMTFGFRTVSGQSSRVRLGERFRWWESAPATELSFADFDGNATWDGKEILKHDEGDDFGVEDISESPDSPLPSEEPALDPQTEGDEELELLDNSESMYQQSERKKGFRRDFAQVKKAGGTLHFYQKRLGDGRLSSFYNYRGISSKSESARRIGGEYYGFGYQVDWLGQLFPHVPGLPPDAPAKPTAWPEEAIELAASLLRTEKLYAIEGGIEISRRTESFDVRRMKLSSVRQSLEIFARAPDRWLVRMAADGGQTTVQWCDAKRRGTCNLAHQLGRVRKSAPQDLQSPPLGLGDYSLKPLDQDYRIYKVNVQRPGPNRAVLVLKYPDNRNYENRIEIDTQRNVVLSRVTTTNGKVGST